jgi:hypothetical protein
MKKQLLLGLLALGALQTQAQTWNLDGNAGTNSEGLISVQAYRALPIPPSD